MAAIESAQSKSDFEQAAAEFQQAAKLAPWWTRLYFNLGSTQEKAGRYEDGIKSFQLYSPASPGDPTAEEARERIYKLEYLKEHEQQEASRIEAERRAHDPKALEGTWRNKETGNSYRVTITGNEFEARRTPGLPYLGDMVAKGILSVPQITGTFEWPAENGPKKICTFPGSNMPMTGTISDDRQSITLHYQVIAWVVYERDGLLFSGCDGVRRDHVEEAIMTLVR
jgi:tetratricopeptide (TPR) repeat protein